MSVVVRFQNFAALHKAAGEQLASGNLFLPKDLAQPQFAAVDVEVETPDGERFELACEILQAFPGATALTIKPASRDALNQLLAHVMKHPADGDAKAPIDVVIGADDDAPAEPVHAGDGSLAAQLAEMTVNEKRTAALHGTKDMRMLILKDHNKTLHPYVMRNPALSMDEVEAASRMTTVHPDVLHLIAKDWARSATVVRNLVRNPKTPMPDALALVDKLPTSELKTIVKSGSVRMAILTAARKRMREPG